MIKLNLDDLAVDSFAAMPPEDEGIAPAAAPAPTLAATCPANCTLARDACPYTQYWGCYTDLAGCESGGGAAC